MSLSELAQQLIDGLEARGLHFERFDALGGQLSILHPRNWQATWNEDHASIHHGTPPQGWLTVYPVPLRQRITSRELLEAFLEEFVAPAVAQLSIDHIGPEDRYSGLESAELAFARGGHLFQGIVLAHVGIRQAQVVSYWVEQPLFRPALIRDLLLGVLGTLQAPEDSPYHDRPTRLEPLPPHAIWQAGGLETVVSFAAPDGRFALRLPEGWRGLEVSYEGDLGWLLLPPGVRPGEEGAPLITISGADLLAPIEETLETALTNLADPAIYGIEHPPQPVTSPHHAGVVQLRMGHPPAAPGRAYRLWSLGLTDGDSIVHLVALAEAEALAGLLPALTAIGHSLRVLPRVPNLELMRQLVGHWRFLDSHDPEGEALECLVHLREDGTYGLVQQRVDPRQRLAGRRPLPEVTGGVDSGTWDIVHTTLSLYGADGVREIFEVESISTGSAIIGKIFWERV